METTTKSGLQSNITRIANRIAVGILKNSSLHNLRLKCFHPVLVIFGAFLQQTSTVTFLITKFNSIGKRYISARYTGRNLVWPHSEEHISRPLDESLIGHLF